MGPEDDIDDMDDMDDMEDIPALDVTVVMGVEGVRMGLDLFPGAVFSSFLVVCLVGIPLPADLHTRADKSSPDGRPMELPSIGLMQPSLMSESPIFCSARSIDSSFSSFFLSAASSGSI